MSRFLAASLSGLTPYTPGEQPRDKTYIKLNTNESPFPPSPAVLAALTEGEAEKLRLYSDPTLSQPVAAIAAYYGVSEECVCVGNGSDEVLSFAFRAWGEGGVTATDVTYGFYPVFSAFYGIPYSTVPLREDFTVDVDALAAAKGTLVLANPNAQTGIYLGRAQIEALVASDPDRVVIVDEAYIDFGGESAVPLTQRYDNLVVVQTFSKSRNLAGARVGFAIGCPALIRDLNTLRFSFNPYNVNRLSLLAATAAMEDVAYFEACTREVARVREVTRERLTALGFEVTPSLANFLLARHPRISGEALYRSLKEKGYLVRHLSDKRIADWVRITVGTEENMTALTDAIQTILEDKT